MSKTVTVLAQSAAAAALLGLALASPAYAQSAGGADSGVKTPSSGGNEVSPRKGPLPGKSTTSAMPDRDPKAVNEAGDARPDDKAMGSTPPAGSATAPNPKTPEAVSEGGDARPMERQGGTSGSAPSGTTRSKPMRDREPGTGSMSR